MFTLLHTVSYLLERFDVFPHSNNKTDPDKEITCCIFPLNSRNQSIGSVVQYLECKGFKIVGIKTLKSLPVSLTKSKSRVSGTAVAIQGKDSVAMVYNYAKHTGYLCTSFINCNGTASPMFCPSTTVEALMLMDQLFSAGEVYDWTRTIDWYIVKENC